MPRRSKIATDVPVDLRESLNAALVANGFSNYVELTAELNDQLAERGLSVTISKTSMHRYGQDYEAEFNAEMAEADQMLRIARQAIAQGEDAEGVVREATARVLQTRLLKLTTALRQAEEAGDDVHKIAETTTKITRALADLGRMDIAGQKYKEEYRAKLATKLNQLESACKAGRKLDAATLQAVRQEVYGLA